MIRPMRFTPAGHTEMAYLMKNLSDLHKIELRRTATFNHIDMEQLGFMLAVWIDAHGCKCARDEHGQILAMYSEAPDPQDPDLRRVWFLVTKFFMTDFARNFRAFREHCRIRIEAEPTHRWTTVTWTQHPKAEKWARYLGFNSIETEGVGTRFTLHRNPATV